MRSFLSPQEESWREGPTGEYLTYALSREITVSLILMSHQEDAKLVVRLPHSLRRGEGKGGEPHYSFLA